MSVTRVNVLRVRTPEGVAFSFRLASPVLRLAALVIDWAAVAAAWSVLATLLALFQLVGRDVMGLVGTVAYFVLSEGYRIYTEWRWRGQTIGKRVLHLRVVDERGLRLTFAQVVLRNLLRFIDALPLAYLVGGVAALVTQRGQRLGDLAAGTLVIWEPEEAVPDPAIWQGEKYNSLRTHGAVVARLRQAVTPNEAQAAWQALARRDDLEAGARVRLFGELAAHFRALTPMPVEAVEGISDEQFVRNLVDVLYLSRTEPRKIS
ncbi:MAG TPA: RDD family protein [Opitutaceae bacterium]|nr:RDD family protein [Opitutaceae bacterium]